MSSTRSGLKLGRITVDHPGARDREAGIKSTARMQLWTQQGTDRSITLSEEDLIGLLRQASDVLAILRGIQ